MTVYMEKRYAKFRTSYSNAMIDDPADIIERFREATKGVKFDTIVGRGTSGMLIVPIVARALRKKWLVVRKDEEVETSHNRDAKVLGDLGERWVFLDDFCSSGRTFRATRDGVKEAVERINSLERWDEESNRYVKRYNFKTELVGYFEYEKRENGNGWHLWDENAVPGYGGGRALDDTPKAIMEKRIREEKLAREFDQRGAENRAQADADQQAFTEAASTWQPVGAIDGESVTLQGGGGGGGAIKTYEPIGGSGNPNCSMGEPLCNCLIPPAVAKAAPSVGRTMREQAEKKKREAGQRITIRTGVF